MGKRLAGMLAFDIFGSLFMGISIVCFAVQANFAPGQWTCGAVQLSVQRADWIGNRPDQYTDYSADISKAGKGIFLHLGKNHAHQLAVY